jgi:HPt (histidine-containing phosphotransfer) domain-containing protein
MKMPILALTANAMKGAEKQVMEAGCSGFLTKPINIDQLLQTLGDLLGGTRIEYKEEIPTAAVQLPPGQVAVSGAPVVSRLAGNLRLRPAIRKFTGRLDEQMDAFEKAFAAQNFAEVASLAHWLKGAAGTVGYDEFTEPAMKLEQAAKDRNTADTALMLAEVRGLAARLVAPEAPASQVPA